MTKLLLNASLLFAAAVQAVRGTSALLALISFTRLGWNWLKGRICSLFARRSENVAWSGLYLPHAAGYSY